MHEVSRRGLLRVGALSGVAATVAAALPAAARAATPAPGERAVGFELTVSHLRSLSGTVVHQPGDVVSLTGVVDGVTDGSFLAHGVAVAARDRTHTGPHSVQTHVFVLPRGTLTATGTVDSHGHGCFTVTGGTGAYARTRGSYTSTQDPAQHRGGTGRFVFTLHV